MSQLVLLERAGLVAILTLNRPDRHNSLTPPFLEAMLAAIESLAGERSKQIPLRACVLQANGRSFSTGGDISGFYEHRENLAAYAGEIVALLNRVILALFDLPAPLVAAVHGQVTGGSLGLVLASDLVLVAPQASFTPYYSVAGFSPDGGWTALLPAVIGPKRAADVLLNNLTISAGQAVTWGLASRLVPGDEIRSAALEAAAALASQPPGTLRRVKSLLSASCGDLAARLEMERAHFVAQIQTEEARRGIAAFLGRL